MVETLWAQWVYLQGPINSCVMIWALGRVLRHGLHRRPDLPFCSWRAAGSGGFVTGRPLLCWPPPEHTEGLLPYVSQPPSLPQPTLVSLGLGTKSFSITFLFTLCWGGVWCMCRGTHVCGGQRATSGNHGFCFVSIMWVPGDQTQIIRLGSRHL